MKKIISFFRKYYIFFTVIIAIILVIVGSIIIVKLINNNKNKLDLKTEDVYLYQYVNDQKKEYKAKLYYEDEKIVSVKSNDYVPYENSLIYYKETDKVLIPKDVMIVFYYQNNNSYKLPKYSIIHNDNSSNVISLNGNKYPEDSFLIYDNEDLYFLVSDFTLNINNNEILLGKYSYIIASTNGITYYDFNKKEVFSSNDAINKAVISIGDLKIDLLTDSLVYNGKVRMLNKDINTLKTYKED